MNNQNQTDETTDNNPEVSKKDETEAIAETTSDSATPSASGEGEKSAEPQDSAASRDTAEEQSTEAKQESEPQAGEATGAPAEDGPAEAKAEEPVAAEAPVAEAGEAKAEEATDASPVEEQAPAKTEATTETSSAEKPGPAEAEAPAEPAVAKAEAPAEPKAEASAEPAASEAEASVEPAASEAEPSAEKSEETPAEAAADQPEAAPAAAASAAEKPAGAEKTGAAEKDEEQDEPEESFEALLEKYDQFRSFRPGDLVEGTVVSLGEQEVLIDIGARVEGNVPASELKDKSGEFVVSDGDKIKVMVCRFNPDLQYVPLSFERARVSQVWDEIEELASKEKLIEGTVIEKVKGGFIVDVGVRAFLPTSQASLRPQKDMQDILGKKLEFNILKIQRRRGNLILSRRDILQEELAEKRSELFEKLHEGAVLKGRVKNITDYGVFIDLGGLDGLLHITDMSWGRVAHPKDMVELGQEIEVKVLRFDREKEKVSLGLKQCQPDPWLSVSEKYPPDAAAKGKVLNLTSYGAFVELEPGVEGMIHVSELSWTKKVRNPAQVLSKGQEVEVRVLDIDTENRRVSLSLKQTEDNPWDSLAERFPVGSKVTGKVRNITEFGAFVEIEDGIDGLVHVSDFLWGERAVDPNEFVKKGDEVEVVILAVDTENHKVSLGMKQLKADPWIEFTKKFKADQIVTAPVSKVTDFGVFLQLSDHIEGLIRQNELNLDRKERIADHFKEGDDVQALITRINHRERKVDLSQRRLDQFHERQALKEYTQKNDTGGAKIGDLIGNELKKLVK